MRGIPDHNDVPYYLIKIVNMCLDGNFGCAISQTRTLTGMLLC